MNKNKLLMVQCTIDASPENVWEALTDNRQMKKWYFDIEDFSPTPGFEFNFTGGNEHKKYVHLCKITEVIPKKKLAYTWKYQDYPGDSMVTFELFPEGEQTKIRVTHEGLETFPPLTDFAEENFKNGWNQIICSDFKNYVENKSKEELANEK